MIWDREGRADFGGGLRERLSIAFDSIHIVFKNRLMVYTNSFPTHPPSKFAPNVSIPLQRFIQPTSYNATTLYPYDPESILTCTTKTLSLAPHTCGRLQEAKLIFTKVSPTHTSNTHTNLDPTVIATTQDTTHDFRKFILPIRPPQMMHKEGFIPSVHEAVENQLVVSHVTVLVDGGKGKHSVESMLESIEIFKKKRKLCLSKYSEVPRLSSVGA